MRSNPSLSQTVRRGGEWAKTWSNGCSGNLRFPDAAGLRFLVVSVYVCGKNKATLNPEPRKGVPMEIMHIRIGRISLSSIGRFTAAGFLCLGLLAGAARAQVTMPAHGALKQMTQETMLDFALAVKAKDFGDFYDTVAKVWQNQTPRDAFGRLFKAFTDKNIDLTVIEGLDPALEKKPFLDNNGWLHLDGAYPTKPSKTHFNLKYFPEDGGWKLVGINIQIS